VSIARKPFYGPRGAVATSQPLATSAGLDVLPRGGSAVDAALAAATTLTVVEPAPTGWAATCSRSCGTASDCMGSTRPAGPRPR
jgi:hypothetical protein